MGEPGPTTRMMVVIVIGAIVTIHAGTAAGRAPLSSGVKAVLLVAGVSVVAVLVSAWSPSWC
ncbi:hypothetical protein [Streptomyces sp. NPDC002324]